jgi:HemX protein
MNDTLVYEITIVLYALSVIFYSIDFLQHNQKANKIAFWLLSIIWALQTAFFISKVLYTGAFPLLTSLESIYFYVWLLTTLSLILNKLVSVDFILFFANVLAFIIFMLFVFSSNYYQSIELSEALVSELLFVHIILALLAYGMCSLSFVLSVMYIIQYRLLKKKKWNKHLRRLGELSKLERVTYYLNVIGVPMLLVSLIIGTVWATIKLESFHWYDPKIIGSMIVVISYLVLLYMKKSNRLNGRIFCQWNVTCYLVLLLNFFVSGSMSSFHFWYA